MEQEYIITVFSENKVGLLSQITTVFTCRDVNIESLTTSESALQGIHKFTIVVRTTRSGRRSCGRSRKVRAEDLRLHPDEVVQQEIALYKVTRQTRRRSGRSTSKTFVYRDEVVSRRSPQGRHAGVVRVLNPTACSRNTR